MRRFQWIAKFVVVQALVLFAIAETGLRVLRPSVANLQVLLYLPSISDEFEGLDSLSELLDTTIIGFHPFTPRAGFVTNSRGLRTHEYTDRKEPGTVRVLAIGDSFAFSSGGIPYSLGWQDRLERRLQSSTPANVELLSLGVPGVGPLFEQRLWQVEGTRLDADVLLFLFFVGNDFTDHFTTDVRRDPGTIAARYSYVARLVRNLTRVRSDAMGGSLEIPDEHDDARSRSQGGFEIPEFREAFAARAPLYSRDRLMQVEANRARLCEIAQAEAFDELFKRFTMILRGFHSEVESSGVEFRMVILPDRYQVNLDEQHAALAHLRMPDRDFDWDKPQRRLREMLDREGISYLDLLEPFREATKHEQLFDPGNTHWNVRGNEFVADQIAEWLGPLPDAS